MAKVHIESVPELIKKAGEIRRQLALGTRRIGNVHIGGPMSATDAAVAIYYKYMDFDPDELDNIVAVVDFNHCSAAFETNENMRWGEQGGPEGMAACLRAFGWNAVVVDGTKMTEIDKALSELPEVTLNGKPNCIICSTQKGQGVTFMEERPSAWHIGGFDDEKLAETLALIDAYTEERLKEVE